MSCRQDKRGRSKGQLSAFVALEHFLLECEAWQSLSLCARQAYVEIARIYSGTNNGKLALSARGLSERLKVSKATASRALKDLGERGFVEIAKHGGFNLKNGNRRAAEWRLTRFKCDVTGQLPSKAFMAWKLSKIHLAVSPQAHPGFTRGTQRAPTPSKNDFVGTTRNRNGVPAMQSGLTTGPHIDIYHTADTKDTASNGDAGRANQRASIPSSLHTLNLDTFQTIGGLALQSLAHLETSLPAHFKSWQSSPHEQHQNLEPVLQ